MSGDCAVFVAAVVAAIVSNVDVVVNAPTVWDHLVGLVLAIAVTWAIVRWVERRNDGHS